MDRLRGQRKASKFETRGVHSHKNPVVGQAYERELAQMEPAMRRNYQLMGDFSRRRMAKSRKLGASGSGGDVFAAIPRFYDPTEFWEYSHLPYDISNDEHRFKLYQWLDLFYRTHDLIPILVDIFTRFPLVGMELHCKDDRLKEFYEDVFFERLDYQEFLVSLGREYWTFGQSFPLGSFNETLGVWEGEELIDPTLVKVTNLPIIGTTQFHLKPPPSLVEIVKSKEPQEAFWRLKNDFPELLPYLENNRDIPVSDVLLKQVAFKVSPRDTHGTPILLRALRTLIHEEKLLSAQDAIAERLYSPLILAKLGTPDLGDGEGPWIPSQDDLAAFRDDLDIALASDFRLLVHHFGIEVMNVFGREQMPRLEQDFDRIEQKIMRTFGVNPSLLQGGSSSQPYASSALQAEFLNQILRTYQAYLKKHFEDRAMIVAEAQEHYDYEKRGETRVPIMEEVVEYDEEGNPSIVEKHKLLIPELRMKVLDLRDEATERGFRQQLRAAGVPVPDQDLSMGMDFDFKESLENYQEEIIQKTVAQQEAKVKAYKILVAKGLPIPPDLKAEVEGAMAMGEQDPMGAMGPGIGGPGGGPLMPAPGETFNVPIPSGPDVDINAPKPGEEILMPPSPDGGVPGAPPGASPRSPMRGTVPEQSRERIPLRSPGSPSIPGGLSGPRRSSLVSAENADYWEGEHRRGDPHKEPVCPDCRGRLVASTEGGDSVVCVECGQHWYPQDFLPFGIDPR